MSAVLFYSVSNLAEQMPFVLEKCVDERRRRAAAEGAEDDDAGEQEHSDNDRRQPIGFMLADELKQL